MGQDKTRTCFVFISFWESLIQSIYRSSCLLAQDSCQLCRLKKVPTVQSHSLLEAFQIEHIIKKYSNAVESDPTLWEIFNEPRGMDQLQEGHYDERQTSKYHAFMHMKVGCTSKNAVFPVVAAIIGKTRFKLGYFQS